MKRDDDATAASFRPTRQMGASIGALLAIVGLLSPSAAGAAALTFHDTYEAPPIGVATLQHPDRVGVTSDGRFNAGRVTKTIEIQNVSGNPVDGLEATLQAAIVDDLFGAGVIGGEFCVNLDQDDYNCDGEERQGTFCGSSPAHEVMLKAGRTEIDVWVNGVFFQATAGCDDVTSPSGPTATTGGVLNPAGGVFTTIAPEDPFAGYWESCEADDGSDVCLRYRKYEDDESAAPGEGAVQRICESLDSLDLLDDVPCVSGGKMPFPIHRYCEAIVGDPECRPDGAVVPDPATGSDAWEGV